MSSLLRRIYAIALTMLIAGCSGGGCSSCAGGAITPIRGGFPITPERRIPHAIQLRLSDQGLRSVQTLGPDLLRGFVHEGISVPTSTGDFGVGRYVICPSPPCILTVDLPTTPPALELGLVPPDQLSARIRIILHGDLPVHTCTLTCDSMCHGAVCPAPVRLTIGIDTRRGSHPYIGLRTNVAVRRDEHTPRFSYMRADLISATGEGDTIQETPMEEIENDDVSCSGSLCGLFGLFRGTIMGAFRSQIGRALQPVQDALSQHAAPDPPGCTTGTRPDGNRCRYDDDTQVPALLGIDGTGNLGALLASLTPGLRAMDSFVIGAGDPMHNAEVSPTGMTVNVLGAVVSNAHAQCVPQLPAPPLPTIPEWANLRSNVIPGTTTTADLGLGIAEDFLNHAAWNLWDSGMFCLGVNTRLSQQLSSNTFTALLPSLRNVIFPGRDGPMAITLRPQQPPTIRVGTGADVNTAPLLSVEFRRMSVDIYAFSEERYVRLLSALTDLTVPVNLATEANGLRPVVGTVVARNTTVSHAALLPVPLTQLANVVEGALGTAVGLFAGNIQPIRLPTIPVPGASGGTVQINVLPEGLVGLTEGTSRYLALFANLHYNAPAAMPLAIELDTTADVAPLPYDPAVYHGAGDFSPERLPRARLTMAAPDALAHDVEYAYRVDGMGWSAWSRERTVEVRSPSFLAQGEHVIEARARAAGAPTTADHEPARVAFVIDADPPTAQVARDGAELRVTAYDRVSAADRLRYHFAFDGRTAIDWEAAPHALIPAGATEYAVRVRDEAGREVSVQGSLRDARPADVAAATPAAAASGGWGCAVPASGTRNARWRFGALGAALALGLAARRRRRGN